MSAELWNAIESGDDKAVQALLAGDPSLASARSEDGVSAILFAMYRSVRELAETIAAAAGTLDVFEAAALARTRELRALLDVEPTLAVGWTTDGFTALHYAAFFGDAAGARVLLDAGADPAAVARNAMRVQPLHSAAAARNLDVARLLLDAGADANAEQQDGYLPLDGAVQNDDAELQALLRERGARTSR